MIPGQPSINGASCVRICTTARLDGWAWYGACHVSEFFPSGMIARRAAQDMPQRVERLILLNTAHKRTKS